jgi:hypothetical protein
MLVSKLTLGTGVLRDAVMRTHFPGDAGSVYGRTARAMSAICECWRCGSQLRGPPGLSVLMPLPGRVPSADREFSHALPRYKKIRSLLCHRGFHGWTCQGPEPNSYVTRLPQNKNAGRPFGARHRLHRPSPGPARPPPEPRYRRRTGTEPAPGPAGMPPGRSPGKARMTLPAATAPDVEGRTPARGTQL